jgi:hypothetical protein
MAIERAFTELIAACRRLQEVVGDLSIVLNEDHPNESVSAIEHWADNAANLQGLSMECVEHAVAAAKHLGPTPDAYFVRRHLTGCTRACNEVSAIWLREFASFLLMEELAVLAGRSKLEWKAWADSLRIAMAHCPPPMETCATALLACWQELSEKQTGLSVTVNSTGINAQSGSKGSRQNSEIAENV